MQLHTTLNPLNPSTHSLPEPPKQACTIGALMNRIGFWGLFSYSFQGTVREDYWTLFRSL